MPINYTRYWQLQTVLLGLVAFGFAWIIDSEKNENSLLKKLKGTVRSESDGQNYNSYDERSNLYKTYIVLQIIGGKVYQSAGNNSRAISRYQKILTIRI